MIQRAIWSPTNKTLWYVALVLIVGFGFALRVTDLGRNGLWYDEILQVVIAQADLTALVGELRVHAAMPLDYLIERLMLHIGPEEFVLRFSSAAFSTMSIPLLYRLGRLLYGGAAGFIGALFLAVASFAIFYAQEARPYSLYAFCALASFYFMYRALRGNRLSDWIAYAACISACVLTHLFALFIVIGQVFFLLIGLGMRLIAPSRARRFARMTRRAVIGVGVAGALVLAVLAPTPYFVDLIGSALRFMAFLLHPVFAAPEQWSGIAPGESPPLPTFDFFYSRILENFSGGGIIASAGFVALGLVGALAYLRRKFWETLFLLIWAILPPALIVLFLIHYATLFAARYLIFALPAWTLLIACGVLVMGSFLGRALFAMRIRTGRARAIAIALVTVIWLVISLNRAGAAIGVAKEDWAHAGDFLERNVRPHDAVIAPGGGSVIFYYAPIASKQHVDADVLEQIKVAEANYARVWFVSDRYFVDPSNEIRAWLERRGALEFAVDNAVTIYYWRLDADQAALLQDAKGMAPPNTARAFVSLAEQFADDGDLATVTAYYDRALTFVRTASARASIFLSEGDVYRRANELARAAESYKAALQGDDSRAEAWIGLARVYLAQGQLPPARSALERALGLNPNSYPALLFLAEYYQRVGQADAAQQAYARAAQIVPDLTIPP